VIKQILAENGQAVEYGQTTFRHSVDISQGCQIIRATQTLQRDRPILSACLKKS
jgi:hypothetical protein